MMKRKQTVLGPMGLLGLSILLVGCGGDSDSDRKNQPDSEQPVPPEIAEYQLNGLVQGLLPGSRLTLKNSDDPSAEPVVVTEDGEWPLQDSLLPGARYSLQVAAIESPAGGRQLQACEVVQGAGTAEGTEVVLPPVQVDCVHHTYFVNSMSTTYRSELWRTDGTPEGTEVVKSFAATNIDLGLQFLTVLGNRLFLSGGDDFVGNELWVSDGTDAGTRVVKDMKKGDPDLPPNPYTMSARPQHLTVVEDWLYFSAQTDNDGTGIWRTDGTEGLVEKIEVPEDAPAFGINQRPAGMTVLDDMIYFTLRDAGWSKGLYRVKANEAPQVAEYLFPVASSNMSLNPRQFAKKDNALYFVSDMEPEFGPEIYRWRDGDEQPVRLTNLQGGRETDNPDVLTWLGDTLFFEFRYNQYDHGLYRLDTAAQAPEARRVEFEGMPVVVDYSKILTTENAVWVVTKTGTDVADMETLVRVDREGQVERKLTKPKIEKVAAHGYDTSYSSGDRLYVLATDERESEIPLWVVSEGTDTPFAVKHSENAEDPFFRLHDAEYVNHPLIPMQDGRVLVVTPGSDIWITDGSIEGSVALALSEPE
ncbi:hypothetical protein KUV44_14540 [Marinobacter daepoensis]|uniref:ELWxxDGT repeat-containing protein n=1 Tax=Marinobacter daepoensis TaxID=262077 RepID=A0ABS3BGY3_9GAMM|nr:hypothetical protein [Marinobacter daepoensis]MBN7769977.1 hypothetical protein [Marinobacter daepoensis]MBY6080365.1 hypothetical protein [Marinobacter daepoensis]